MRTPMWTRMQRGWMLVLLGALPWMAGACDPDARGAGAPAPAPPQADGPIGFASVNSLGQNGTTGGAGGPTVVVRTAAAFLEQIALPGPRVVMVDGVLSLPGPMHDVASDKTVIGLGSASGLRNGGLQIGLRNSNDDVPPNAIHNVIVRNLSISDCPDDCINIQEFSHHIWIDHNDLSRPSDGALDIKRGSDFVTVSWNHFFDSDKNALLGHSDSNADQDVGRLKITYHHNWFDGTVQRNPRVRFGEPVHVFNNYYSNVSSYGVASQQNAGVLVEGNFFENTRRPTRNDVGGAPGRIVQRLNVFVGSDPPFSTGTVMEPGLFYDYTLDAPETVPERVRAGAGTGRLGP